MIEWVQRIDFLAEFILTWIICSFPILLLLSRRKKKRYEKRYREAKRFDGYSLKAEKLLTEYAKSIEDQIDSPLVNQNRDS
jgi:hypothetical protein